MGSPHAEVRGEAGPDRTDIDHFSVSDVSSRVQGYRQTRPEPLRSPRRSAGDGSLHGEGGGHWAEARPVGLGPPGPVDVSTARQILDVHDVCARRELPGDALQVALDV